MQTDFLDIKQVHVCHRGWYFIFMSIFFVSLLFFFFFILEHFSIQYLLVLTLIHVLLNIIVPLKLLTIIEQKLLRTDNEICV